MSIEQALHQINDLITTGQPAQKDGGRHHLLSLMATPVHALQVSSIKGVQPTSKRRPWTLSTFWAHLSATEAEAVSVTFT